MGTDINSLRPRPNRRHFADDTFKLIFLNENVTISIKFSLKFVSKVRINNIPALVQMMAWRRPGDEPLSEPMMVSLLRHICVTRPQWINSIGGLSNFYCASRCINVWRQKVSLDGNVIFHWHICTILNVYYVSFNVLEKLWNWLIGRSEAGLLHRWYLSIETNACFLLWY